MLERIKEFWRDYWPIIPTAVGLLYVIVFRPPHQPEENPPGWLIVLVIIVLAGAGLWEGL